MDRFCKDVKPGEGRIVKCIKEHKANLSPECSALIERKPPKTAKQT